LSDVELRYGVDIKDCAGLDEAGVDVRKLPSVDTNSGGQEGVAKRTVADRTEQFAQHRVEARHTTQRDERSPIGWVFIGTRREAGKQSAAHVSSFFGD
jgi:hypothetical protein